MKSKIKNLKAREILDSRGNPTIEVELETNDGVFLASVPSGVSKGKYEAVELRDGRKRYNGMGVLKAVNNVNKIIAPKLIGKDPTKQKEIDNFLIKLDGTKNKSRLGANAILGTSMAVCRAGASAKNIPLYQHIREIYNLQSKIYNLPSPSILMIEGGAHAGNELDFQEFMIVPYVSTVDKIYRCRKSQQFEESLRMGVEIYQELKNLIKEKYIDLAINVGDEGGFAPPVRAPEEAIELILNAAKNIGYQSELAIILDVAASQFYKKGSYKLRIGTFTRKSLLNYYSDLIEKYPIGGLEDPFAQDDWEAWKIANCKLQIENLLIIGDDLTVTNPKRIKMAKEKKACNGIIVKPNQIGTITEAITAAKIAKSYGWRIMVSHRSGETCDDFIADLAVGIGADYIKAGAPARGERVAKYNRLLRIEEELEK